MNKLVIEINELRNEIDDFNRQPKSETDVNDCVLEQLHKELKLQTDLLAMIASKLDSVK